MSLGWVTCPFRRPALLNLAYFTRRKPVSPDPKILMGELVEPVKSQKKLTQAPLPIPVKAEEVFMPEARHGESKWPNATEKTVSSTRVLFSWVAPPGKARRLDCEVTPSLLGRGRASKSPHLGRMCLLGFVIEEIDTEHGTRLPQVPCIVLDTFSSLSYQLPKRGQKSQRSVQEECHRLS